MPRDLPTAPTPAPDRDWYNSQQFNRKL